MLRYSSKRAATLGKPHCLAKSIYPWPYPNLPQRFIVFYSWISSSFPRPPAKRAVAIAMINAFSQLGNVAGSYVWDLPENGFRKSYGIVTAMFGVTIVGCFMFRMVLVRMNHKLDQEEGVSGTAGTHEEGGTRPTTPGKDARPEMLHKGFRYLV